MKTKNIKLGAIAISNWEPSSNRMFSWDFYYDEKDQFNDESAKKDVKECNPKEVVLAPNKTFTLVIDYPTSTPYKAKIKTGKKGLSRIKLTEVICKHYRKMYAEEDESSDSKYGIWGHSIGDLVLVDADIDAKGNITLGVDS